MYPPHQSTLWTWPIQFRIIMNWRIRLYLVSRKCGISALLSALNIQKTEYSRTDSLNHVITVENKKHAHKCPYTEQSSVRVAVATTFNIDGEKTSKNIGESLHKNDKR